VLHSPIITTNLRASSISIDPATRRNAFFAKTSQFKRFIQLDEGLSDMISGIGIDLVDVSRLKKIIARWDGRFTGRYFSQREIAYCQKKAIPAIHYAARFAAKESFLKSLGIGLGMGIELKDIEVMSGSHGKPELILHEEAGRLLLERGIRKVHLSLTHTSESAVAVVVLEI